MESSRRFGSAVVVGLLSAWPLGYTGVWMYLLWRPLLQTEYATRYMLLGAFSALAVAGIAVLFIGIPTYVFLERRGWLTRSRFTVFGACAALIAYRLVFWGIGGGERLEIAVQALISFAIGAAVAAVIVCLASPHRPPEKAS